MLEVAAAFVLLAVTIWIVAGPLRARQQDGGDQRDAVLRADLEAAKDAKLREIRDAELDRDTGKLSREDWQSLDRQLRAEAIEILHRLDRLG